MVDTDARVDKMSVLQQVLTDARKLATRLRDHDSSADSLLSQAQGMFKQVETMKEYCEEMNELNEAANNRPRSALIHSIQQENRHIRQLQQENKELRLALEEHQNVMELIMSKYRQQVAKLVSVNKKQTQPNTHDQAKLQTQIERVSEMVAVMRKAASLGDDECQQQQRLISALATENKGLREMLSIASRSGSLQPPMSAVDVETQTDHNMLNLEENNLEEMQSNERQEVQSNEHQEKQSNECQEIQLSESQEMQSKEHQEKQSNECQEMQSNEHQEKKSNEHQESTDLKKTQSESKSAETDGTLAS